MICLSTGARSADAGAASANPASARLASAASAGGGLQFSHGVLHGRSLLFRIFARRAAKPSPSKNEDLFIGRLEAEAFVKACALIVSRMDGKPHIGGIAPTGMRRHRFQQAATQPRAAHLGGDIEVLHIDAGPPAPGGEFEEEQRQPDGLAVTSCAIMVSKAGWPPKP